MNIKLFDANNGGGNAWNDTDRKVWIWKRSGSRRTDTLFYQAPDAEIEGSDPESAGTDGTFSSGAGLTTNASGGSSRRIRWTSDTNGKSLSGNRIDCGYFRYDLLGASIPAGLFRVLARTSVVSSGVVTITNGDFDFALGYLFGAVSKTPVLADDIGAAGSSEDEWHTIDLGSIVLPVTAVPDGFTNPTQELRIHVIWNHGSELTSYDSGDFIEWALDHIQLVPADEGLVIVDAVGTADRVLSDGQTDRPGVYELNTSDVVQKFAAFTGQPFSLGPEPTRIGWVRDDTGDPTTIQATVIPTHIPQLTGF